MSIINHPTLAGDMGMLNVLVTGFQPFGQHEKNISADTVLELKDTYMLEDPWASKRNNSSLVEVSIEKKILTVDLEAQNSVRKNQPRATIRCCNSRWAG